jgi:hypothetical protein
VGKNHTYKKTRTEILSERALLFAYARLLGELPPLNFNLPVKTDILPLSPKELLPIDFSYGILDSQGTPV